MATVTTQIGSTVIVEGTPCPVITYSVATFMDLGGIDSPADGALVAVTAESGLGSDTLVSWSESGSNWLLLRTSCSYDTLISVELGATPGRWYDFGGVIVDTDDEAVIWDTTYNTPWYWDAASSVLVPPLIAEIGTIAGLQSIKGDSAAPSGWTVTEVNAGGTAAITSDGTKVTLSATTSGAGLTYSQLVLTDASLTSAGRAYMRALVQATTLTAGSSASEVYTSLQISDGTDGFDFGTLKNTAGTLRAGGWFNASTRADYTAQSANTGDLETSEILVEIRKIGTAIEARVGGGLGTWQAIAGATVRNTASTQFALTALASRSGGTATAVLTLRHVRVMRF